MSRIGKNPVVIPAGVTVVKDGDGLLVVKGPKGELRWKPHDAIVVTINEADVTVTKASESRLERSLHGLTRTLIQNMVTGVTKGFTKTLEVNGVGYRLAVQGTNLVLNLGFSHPINYKIPAGITMKIDDEKKNVLYISGTDKQLVGQVAAEVRSYREPEPYLGKGIKYADEHIRRKAGKAAGKAA